MEGEGELKKKAKKLVLAKETVASLELDDLRQVAGGTLYDSLPSPDLSGLEATLNG